MHVGLGCMVCIIWNARGTLASHTHFCVQSQLSQLRLREDELITREQKVEEREQQVEVRENQLAELSLLAANAQGTISTYLEEQVSRAAQVSCEMSGFANSGFWVGSPNMQCSCLKFEGTPTGKRYHPVTKTKNLLSNCANVWNVIQNHWTTNHKTMVTLGKPVSHTLSSTQASQDAIAELQSSLQSTEGELERLRHSYDISRQTNQRLRNQVRNRFTNVHTRLISLFSFSWMVLSRVS